MSESKFISEIGANLIKELKEKVKTAQKQIAFLVGEVCERQDRSRYNHGVCLTKKIPECGDSTVVNVFYDCVEIADEHGNISSIPLKNLYADTLFEVLDALEKEIKFKKDDVELT